MEAEWIEIPIFFLVFLLPLLGELRVLPAET
jgi:hypothetical protein